MKVEGAPHSANAQNVTATMVLLRMLFSRTASLSPVALAALRRNADLLHRAVSRIPDLRLVIEGHCDERGSAEYNLGLGDRRAQRVAASLAEFGARLPNPNLISYGKERPECTEAHESCWRRNRRAHFVVHVPERD